MPRKEYFMSTFAKRRHPPASEGTARRNNTFEGHFSLPCSLQPQEDGVL